MAKIGKVIEEKYEILKEVGRGGMSTVYLAMDKRLNKQWAIKEIRKKGTNGENQIVMQSLLSEANLMKKLDHPNLPRIVDIIDNRKTIYIVMDYIEGEPLDKILKKRGAQMQEAVIEWGRQLAEVLDYLHTRNPPIIYRDMKPANIMLKPDGSIKLYDFGIAREYKENNLSDTVSLGTKGYAAPEQFGGMGQTDARTDIYGLGVTLYHLITGKNPCELPYEILPIRDVNPQLSSGFEAVIQKCTQLNPSDRFQSCAEVLWALNHLDKLDESYRKGQKRKLKIFMSTVVCTIVMAVAGTGTYIGYQTTLKQTIHETLELYGRDSAGGGNVSKLQETIETYGDNVSEEELKNLIENYVDVITKKIFSLADEYSNISDKQLTEKVRKDYQEKEKELFQKIDKVIENNVEKLEVQHRNKVYYNVGNIYMEYYQFTKGRFDKIYIKNRYEEAANRFRHITDNYDKNILNYTKKVCEIGSVIYKFNMSNSGMSDNNMLIVTEEELKQDWEKMANCIKTERSEERKVNLYHIVGCIIREHILEYKPIKNKLKPDMMEFSNQSIEFLDTYSKSSVVKTNQKDMNRKIKVEDAKKSFEEIQQILENGGRENE